MKNYLLLLALLAGTVLTFGQTAEELRAAKAEKKDSISAIQGRVDAIQAKLDAMPGWRKGAFGTIGVNIANFNNWYAQGVPNNSSGNIGVSVNAYANLKEENFFWRNSANLNLQWVKLDNEDDPTDSDEFRQATDVFNISSLYGRNISKTFAASALGEYRTTILSNFNDPGYLDLGVGGTWTPMDNLVVVIHPLNYNFVFSSEDTIFNSSLGAKVVADYTRQLGAISFKSNLSLFQSYESGDLSNWTWSNSFAYTLWKMIGVGFDFGLRNSKQEALNYAINTLGETDTTFETVDNELQTYWRLGLSYSF
ncbi:DUF3078 domain-containing protein [Zeaxanthinibacter sp. PT1]|uniref:DUF3078 domain-containing protein n=1 Tax=Zeaxanthinibacter TaxID=561554 RepID=UPI00234A4BFD|nr:DUF3078 domain-containing protein [Zeaxanthinibacter sp. PT1]MDC6350525.1 DUF3078 domain-containing protein [Zeaxanthinibacter sp. PT1]